LPSPPWAMSASDQFMAWFSSAMLKAQKRICEKMNANVQPGGRERG